MATQKAAGIPELTRYIVKELKKGPTQQDSDEEGQCNTHETKQASFSQVSSIFRCFGNFINFCLKRGKENQTLLADIYQFGTVVINQNSVNFVPAHLMQAETHVYKSMPIITGEIKRSELALGRISSVTQMSEKQTSQVLSLLSKAIGYYLTQEQVAVVIDLQLTNNEALVMTPTSAGFLEKRKLRETNR